MNSNSHEEGNPKPEFDQAVIAHLQATNPSIAAWVADTLLEDHTLETILEIEESAIDPANDDAVELTATAIEMWVLETGVVSPMALSESSESENGP